LKVGLVLTASRKAGAFLRVGAAVDAVVVVELEEIVAELPPVINGI
jgi:preprotein translocase subunit SecD